MKKSSSGGHVPSGADSDVESALTSSEEAEPLTLVERAHEAIALRGERYEARRLSLIDPTAEHAAEVTRLDAEIAALDLTGMAYQLRQEFVALKDLYERLDVSLTLPPVEPREVDVLTEQCKLNEERHGHYATNRDLPSWLDGSRDARGIEGLHYRRLRPQTAAEVRAQTTAALTTGEDMDRG
jgi:hypothetical protein